MKKRLLKLSSLILSLAMVLSLFCIASLTSNAESNVIYVDQSGATEGAYTTLADAVSNATAGDTVLFLNDYTATSAETVSIAITIDLGGYTYMVRTESNAQGIQIKKTGVVIQNGKMVLDSKNTQNSTAYYCIFNYSSGKLTVKNVDFEFISVGSTANGANTDRPGALIRNYGTETTEAYNCSFIYSGTRDFDDAALVASSYGTVKLYNCKFDGNENKISAIQVRARDTTSNYSKISIYNCEFNNVKYLFARNAKLASATNCNSAITIYGATVNNANALCAEPDNVNITAAEHATMPDLDTLTSPYTFEVTCAHSFVDGVCEYCKAPEPTAPSVPAITMDSGAAMRIDSKTDGIRFSATVDKSELDGFGYEITDAGMLVAKESIASTETMTVENSVTVTSAGQTIADGKVIAARYNGATLKTAEDAGKYVIVGSLVEISKKNANQNYVARAFIEYKDANGNTAYIYSDLSDARSIAKVASLIQQEGLAKPDDNTVYYNTLCGTHKNVVDDWAARFIG